MPKVSVNVPHNQDPDEVVKKTEPYLQKIVDDFEGRDLEIDWDGRNADFSFFSLAFKIKGSVAIEDNNVRIDVDLPFAAMMFKDKVQKAITKNLTKAFEDGGDDGAAGNGDGAG